MSFFLKQVLGLFFPTRVGSLEQFIELLVQKGVTTCGIFKGGFDKYSAWLADGSHIVYYPKWKTGDLFMLIAADMDQIKEAIPDITFRLVGGAKLIEEEVALHKKWKRYERALEEVRVWRPDLYEDLV